MELFLFLLIPLVELSSAGNDTIILSTVASSPLPVYDMTAVQEEQSSSTFTSQHMNVMASQFSTTESTTTALLTSGHTDTTDESRLFSSYSTSGQDIITSTLATSKPYTGPTLNAISSSVTKITDGAHVLPQISTTLHSSFSMSELTAAPSQAPDNGLTLLAFGVMSLILVLIVVMVVLVTVINLRGRCRDVKQHEGIKSCDSGASGSNRASNCEKESITLVSVRTIDTENNTDSPQISSVHSTIVDSEDQELTRDLLGIKDGL